VSKKLNHKDRVNNIVALPGESVSSSWDRFTSFLRSVPNHRIDDESLKEYFYRGQDDNNKAVLDTIAGGSYGECPYDEIAEKLEKISRNNKAWSTRKSDTGRNTFAVHMVRGEDMLYKMMRRFDASDEHIKELRGDLASIGKKFDTHAISIKQIELQMAQLSATVNIRQPGTLASNTVQNPKKDAHCMEITTRGGKQTIDPPMPSNEENVRKDDDKVVKGSVEEEERNGKDAEVPMKVIHMPRPPTPLPYRLVKKTKDGKYRRFITMLKHLSINVPLVEVVEQMPGYAKFMKDLVTKKRSVSFQDDDRLQHCSAIATTSLVQNKEDPGAFTIPCTVGSLYFAKALCDLGESINLMPLSIYKKLGLGDPKPTALR
ncbi:hypothetical protein EJD97_021392, partial [Solanum chilense]